MYKKSANRLFKHLDFFIFDLIIVMASYAFACFLRYQFQVPPAPWGNLFIRCGVALAVIFFLLALISRNYKNILQRNKWIELEKVLIQIVLTYVTFVLFLYIIGQDDFSRQIYLVSAALSLVIIWCERVFWKHILRITRAKNNNLPQLLIICEEDSAVETVKTIRQKQYDYFRVMGAVVFRSSFWEDARHPSQESVVAVKPVKRGQAGSGNTLTVPVVCAPEDLKEYLLNHVVDEVYISLKEERKEQEIINYCLELGVTVHLGLAGSGMDYPNASIGKLGGNTVMTTSNAVTDNWRLLVKRLVDILGGIAGCLIMLLLCAVVGPAIRKADPGPVFFRQERVGKNGRRFMIYKFRSMYQDAEEQKTSLMEQNEMKGQIFKIKDDPRILPGVGEKIRRFSIDEWPQFLNVLKGDMSLVGTRPPTVEEYEAYEPHHKARLSFKPGITGLWQVSGRNQITDFEKIVEMDNTYIRSWSLGLDAKILCKTILVVLKHEGAE